ncbi:copper chaperone for superoxide dismutase, chloroplastic/cytosolic isoform X1 [Diospyros lotus]|uniref:copper chaperone for superoxide dismutase, chloroplastic/cytosolic isoform X1 n=1 Tax=Diospyros lotus TaxID=55363 RepID=UPI00225982E9|nr:copper chaperone for superoxide dismutase, chloroplastic/cytosolic isoform X1 [Diospyros lotus]
MAFLRSVASTVTTAVALTALPAAFLAQAASSSSSSSSSSSLSSRISKTLAFPSRSCNSIIGHNRLVLVSTFTVPPSAIHMDAPTSQQNYSALPELLTEYMVDMKCDGCVNAVRNKLETIDGVKNVEVDLSNQVVRILGSSPVKTMTEALEQTGRKARLIGQGVPEGEKKAACAITHRQGDRRDYFLVSAAVAEFKGPDIFGLVRLAQVNMELARIEANFSGLSPGKHGWSINEFGDLTKGPASTGKVFNPSDQGTDKEMQKAVGDLGTLDADEKGEALFSGAKEKLRVGDVIGRSIVVYEREDSNSGLTAAVIARSAGVGENYKKICTCDGTTIWEATNQDFVTSKV